MRKFYINKLTTQDNETAQNKYPRTFNEGNRREYAVQKHYDSSYEFAMDRKKFYQHSDVTSQNASVKSSYCTLFVDRNIINNDTDIVDAVQYFINKDVSKKYFIVLDVMENNKQKSNQYTVIQLNKAEMKALLLECACLDYKVKENGKDCLRLKKSDMQLYKWFLENK